MERKTILEKLIPFIIAFLSFLLSTKGIHRTAQIVGTVIIAIAIAAYGIYLLVENQRATRGVGSNVVIIKTKRYMKHLDILIKTSDHNLKKIIKVGMIKKLENDNKKILKTSFKEEQKEEDKTENKRLMLLREKFKKKYCHHINNIKGIRDGKFVCEELTKQEELKSALKVSPIIIKTIWEMNRIFLQLDQYHLRLKAGQYVAKYASCPYDRAKAYIDLLGWTYILKGYNKKGYHAITAGIEMIDIELSAYENKTSLLSEKAYYKLKLLKVRALRHLGTTYYTYRTKEGFAEKNLQKALMLLKDPQLLEFYVNNKKDDDTCIKSKLENQLCFAETYQHEDNYKSMKLGIENNLYIAEFYRVVDQMKTYHCCTDSLQNIYNKIDVLINELRSDGGKGNDNHRMIKMLALKSQIIQTSKFYTEQPINDANFKKDLREIEKILDRNIYFDEAIEVYVNLKIQTLYDDVKEILEKESK